MHLKLVFLWIPVLWAAFCCVVLIFLERIGFFRPRYLNLRIRGIDLELSGHPDQAEKCYREALKMAPMIPIDDRTRLMVCLGDSLAWQEQYDEAMIWFEKALALGDPTGSCQESICDLLLILREDPERAVILAGQARDLARDRSNDSRVGSKWNALMRILEEVKCQARKANALAIAGKQNEALESIGESLRLITGHREEIKRVRPNPPIIEKIVLGSRFFDWKRHQLSDTHWRIGLALSAMGDRKQALEQFRLVRGAHAKGVYGIAASRKLAEMAAESS